MIEGEQLNEEYNININEKIAAINELDELLNRASGRTTRLVDSYIQELYNNIGEWVEIFDHYNSKMAHITLLKKIYNRICFEHPQDRNYIQLDHNNRIRLNKPVDENAQRRKKELLDKLKNFKNK